MILRKPYAFLIKYFKLIHVALVIMMCYLLYRTSLILNFFGEYISSTQIITGKDFTGTIFSKSMFYLPFIIIVILVILLGVMIYKKKPRIFYIINIFVMIAILVFYNVSYNMLSILEAQIMDIRIIRLMRDVNILIVLVQGISLIFTFVRATGFDIKKFDFRKDLQELDITEEDAEEFEVDVDFESDLFKRELRKNIRFAKYIYIENKFIIDGIFLIVFSIICFIIYMNLTIYNKTYKQGVMFSANEFNMSVIDSYLTSQDYNGNKITNNYLLIVKINLKANYDDVTVNRAKTQVKINGRIYYPINGYNERIIDLGNVYTNTVIDTQKFEEKLFVYEIPKNIINDKMLFEYLDDFETSNNGLNPKYIKVRLTPSNLDLQTETKIIELNSDIVLNNELFGDLSFNISNIDIQEKFKLNYKYCRKTQCYDSVEYLNPILNTNYDKSLLKLEGQLTLENSDSNIKSLYTLVKYFGKIKYKTSRKIRYYNLSSRVNPKKTTLQNEYYLEIPKEILTSDNISLVLNVRNKSYEYVIK